MILSFTFPLYFQNLCTIILHTSVMQFLEEFAKDVNNNQQMHSNMVTREVIHFVHRDSSCSSFILQIRKFLRSVSSWM
jgi:hypothetical protein